MGGLSRALALAAMAMVAHVAAGPATASHTDAHVEDVGALRRQVRELVDREAIRDKIQLYTLLHDGDGMRTDTRGWADRTWTADATFQVVNPDGSKMFTDAPEGLRGREALFRLFGRGLPPGLPLGFRHMLSAPAFDLIGPTTARTRTIDLNFSGPTFVPEPVVPQALVSAFVFHDTWVKEADGEWRKSGTVVYCTIGCQHFGKPMPKSR